MNYTLIGCGAALISSAAWAFDPILYRKLGTTVSPLGMNLGRGVIGFLYIGIFLLISGIHPVPTRSFLYLGMSGLLGIALGDTFFLQGLVRLGPRLSVLMETLCPVLSVFLAVIFLRERPSLPVWGGIALTILGVFWVLWERAPRVELKEKWKSGIKFGLLSVTCTSFGIILAKKGLESVPPLEGTLIKLFFGTMGLLIWGLWGRRLGNWVSPFKNPKVLRLLFFAVFIGIGIGLLFSVVALKYADASIAVPLNSVSPLFILPMAAIAFREKVSFRSILGTIASVCGIVIILMHS